MSDAAAFLEQAICQIPQDAAITATDAAKHALVGPLAQGRGDITALALWLLGERSPHGSEKNAPFVNALPVCPLSEPAPRGHCCMQHSHSATRTISDLLCRWRRAHRSRCNRVALRCAVHSGNICKSLARLQHST